MDQFSGILLHMDFVDPDLFRTVFRLNLHITVVTDRQIELGNLIVLRVVRIEIILPVKPAHLMDAAVGGKADGKRIFDDLAVQDRQCSRHSGADRAGMGVGTSAEGGGTGTENLGLRRQFYVDLQSDDGFVCLFHRCASFSAVGVVFKPCAVCSYV